jgi:flagellar hook assembly protein FlgD
MLKRKSSFDKFMDTLTLPKISAIAIMFLMAVVAFGKLIGDYGVLGQGYISGQVPSTGIIEQMTCDVHPSSAALNEVVELAVSAPSSWVPGSYNIEVMGNAVTPPNAIEVEADKKYKYSVPGEYVFAVDAYGQGIDQTARCSVQVGIVASCEGDPLHAAVGQEVKWHIDADNIYGHAGYLWEGTFADGTEVDPSPLPNRTTRRFIYDTPGIYALNATVRDSSSYDKKVNCTVRVYDYRYPIIDYYIAPGHFDPIENESANVHYEIRAPGKLSVKIVDAHDYNHVYKTIIDDQSTIPGEFTHPLDGKDASGNYLPAGTYKVAISLVHDYGSAGAYPGFVIDEPEEAEEPLEVTDVYADPDRIEPGVHSTEIHFSINKDADVEARIYVLDFYVQFNFPNLRAGDYEFEWDGTYSGGYSVEPNRTYYFDIIATSGDEEDTLRGSLKTYMHGDPVVSICAGFPDVPADDPYCESIQFVKSIGAMTGMANGEFNPSGLLQRDQIAKIALVAFDLFRENTRYCPFGEKPFPDIGLNDWSYQYVCRAKSLGVITGYKAGEFKGLYKPTRLVSRAELLAIILRNIDEEMPSQGANFDDVPAGAWYENYARFAKKEILYPGSVLYPEHIPTRKEAAVLLYNLHLEGKL